MSENQAGITRHVSVVIVTFNPVRERGLGFLRNPQSPVEMLTGAETKLSTQYHQVSPGGDIAVLLGMCKHVLAADDKAESSGPRVLEVDFIDQHIRVAYRVAQRAYCEMANHLAERGEATGSCLSSVTWMGLRASMYL